MRGVMFWSLPVALLLGLAQARAEAPAPKSQQAAPVAAAPAPTVIVLSETSEEELTAWMAARLANARAGRREIVRVPVVRRSLGWGCRCPSYYLGLSTIGNELGLGWLSLDLEAGLTEPPETSEGAVVLAEGWFTGRTETEDLRNPDGEPEDWLYTLDKLHVTRLRPLRSGDKEQLEVVLGHPESAQTVESLPADRPWVVLVGSADLVGAKTDRWATKLITKLTGDGFGEARALDSRQLPALWCCARVVVAGLFATREEANKTAKLLNKKGYSPQVREGF